MLQVRRSVMSLVLMAGLATTGPKAGAQGTTLREAWVGSETELYLRAMSISAGADSIQWTVRPVTGMTFISSVRGASAHPWKAHFAGDEPVQGLSLLRPSVSTSFNSSLPWGFNDGAVWQGKGMTLWGTAGADWQRGPWSIRLEPEAFVAQNLEFPLVISSAAAVATPLLDGLRPYAIDLPQRFGTGRYARIDPGQSHIQVAGHGVVAGFSTENAGWGPALRNPLLFGANASGIPRLFIGSDHPILTPLGRLQGQVLYGRLGQSDWAPSTRGDGERLGTGFLASWAPRDGGFELGLERFYHKDWPTSLGVRTLLVPFGSVFFDPSLTGSGTDDNQLGAVFARLVSAAAGGFEVFGEFGKNDRNADPRDAFVEPEQNSAWLLGFLKTVGIPSSNSFWSVRAELIDGRITSLTRLRPQATFYEHASITEGHTILGQLLGSPLLERTGGLEMAVDHWTASGRIGAVLTERMMPADRLEGSTLVSARTQWALEINETRFRGASDVSWKAGVLGDFDRVPGVDMYSFFTGLAWRPGRRAPGGRGEGR